MKVKDCMCNDVCCVKPETKINEVAKIMSQNHIGCVPVCDQNNCICGIITDRDMNSMVQDTEEVRMEIIWTIAQQVIYAVIFGVQIHFVNVWEEICAVAFKVKTGCMVWSYYGDSCDFTDLCRSYRDKFIFSACTGLFSGRMC